MKYPAMVPCSQCDGDGKISVSIHGKIANCCHCEGSGKEYVEYDLSDLQDDPGLLLYVDSEYRSLAEESVKAADEAVPKPRSGSSQSCESRRKSGRSSFTVWLPNEVAEPLRKHSHQSGRQLTEIIKDGVTLLREVQRW